MTKEEEYDHLQIRIKHLGPCPLEKGHANGDIGFGIMLGTFMSSFIWIFLGLISGIIK